MSRLFEALQKSEPEGFRFDFVQPEPPANEPPKIAEATAATAATDADVLDRFPSQSISVPREGRLVSLLENESLGAEKFRFLAVRLRQMRQARHLKKVLITSTIPEEGKSVVSANLAVTLARRKPQRVLLLEGDLRRPVLARDFGLPNLAGLSECLQGEAKLTTNIYRLEGTGLWFLPAGAPPENPLELMQSGRLVELLDQLTAWFDWIIIDSPPILPLADTSVWARIADGILLVAREGTTQKRQLKRGLEALTQPKLLGVVLNGSTNADHSNYYQRYGRIVPPTRQH
jgi:capsular exopolysaccharide synthesis family protein